MALKLTIFDLMKIIWRQDINLTTFVLYWNLNWRQKTENDISWLQVDVKTLTLLHFFVLKFEMMSKAGNDLMTSIWPQDITTFFVLKFEMTSKTKNNIMTSIWP